MCAVLIGGPITGGAVNSVRALGPATASGRSSGFWVHLRAPTLGGIFAALTFDRVTGRATAPPDHHPA